MALKPTRLPASTESLESVEGREADQSKLQAIPPIRWIMVGYFFWVGIFLGALIMHATTGY